MHTLNFSHQEELFNPAIARKVIVIGVGSVGSWVVSYLARMGVIDIEVWDHDYLESHNIPMSAYVPEQIGMYKVDALQEISKKLGVTLTIHCEKYTGQRNLRNAVVVSCVDDMETRRVIWEEVKRNRVSIDLFCDTRVGQMFAECFAIAPCDPKDVARYEAMLFPDDEALRQSCGWHGVVFVATRAAGIVTANIASFWSYGTKEWHVPERCDTLRRVA